MNEKFETAKLSEEAKDILRKNGINPNSSDKNAAKSLMSSLSPTDAKKINAILNDKAALKQVLSSERAKAVINQLFKSGDK